jgi:hypothetical protein
MHFLTETGKSAWGKPRRPGAFGNYGRKKNSRRPAWGAKTLVERQLNWKV